MNNVSKVQNPELPNGAVNMQSSSPQVIVAHLGARMHYAVPLLLHQEGLLGHLFTDTYVGKGSWLYPIFQHLPAELHRGVIMRLAQRMIALPAEKVSSFNLWGLRYWTAWRRGSAQAIRSLTQAFGEKVAASPHMSTATLVYGFAGASLELLHAAKLRGLPTIIEQMSVPLPKYYSVLKTEAARWPGWSLKEYKPRHDPAWFSREANERDLADILIAPSNYVQSTLVADGVPPDKIVTIPYAVSPTAYPGREHNYDGSRPLRVLFVGTVNLGKGIPYLLEALRELGPGLVEAKLVGGIALRPDKLMAYGDVIQAIGRIPRMEVKMHYDWADIFVLPSLCEGSATVTYEARACGLPVVATPNTGAWIEDGQDGLVVPSRDVQSLVGALKEFIKQPTLVRKMSRIALQRTPDFSWNAYQQRLATLVWSLHQGGNMRNDAEKGLHSGKGPS